MRSEHRAWVSVVGTPTIALSLTRNSKGAVRLAFNFAVTNTGKNPASVAYVNLAASDNKFPNVAWQKKVCAEPNNGLGASIFPGATVTLFGVTWMSTTDFLIDKYGSQFLDPRIVACVVYQDAVTHAWHHSPLALRIGDKGDRPFTLENIPFRPSAVYVEVSPVKMRPD